MYTNKSNMAENSVLEQGKVNYFRKREQHMDSSDVNK